MLINRENLDTLKRKLKNIKNIGWIDEDVQREHYIKQIRIFEHYLQHNDEQVSVEFTHQRSNVRNYDKTYIQQLEQKRYLQDKYNYVVSGSHNKSY